MKNNTHTYTSCICPHCLFPQIPDDFSPGKYLFKIVALNGKEVVFNQTAEVAVAPRGPTVLVQTDKPVYKPGQTGDILTVISNVCLC